MVDPENERKFTIDIGDNLCITIILIMIVVSLFLMFKY